MGTNNANDFDQKNLEKSMVHSAWSDFIKVFSVEVVFKPQKKYIENYNEAMNADIVLVLISGQFEFNEHIQPIRLKPRETPLFPLPKSLRAAGWGRGSNINGLQWAVLPVLGFQNMNGDFVSGSPLEGEHIVGGGRDDTRNLIVLGDDKVRGTNTNVPVTGSYVTFSTERLAQFSVFLRKKLH